jgi:endonuclease YncB( thermonuclease family)
LAGYDAPERGEKGWLEAKIALEKLVLGKTVRCRFRARGYYGRPLVQVWSGGKNVNAIMKRVVKQIRRRYFKKH